MQLESYNVILSAIAAFRNKRQHLATKYHLEALYTGQRGVAKEHEPLAYLNDPQGYLEEQQASVEQQGKVALDPKKVTPAHIKAYKDELRQLLKQRREKIAYYQQQSGLEFYTNLFFEHLVRRTNILAEIRRVYFMDAVAEDLFETLVQDRAEISKQVIAGKQRLADYNLNTSAHEKANLHNTYVNSIQGALFASNIIEGGLESLSPQQYEDLMQQISDIPVLNEHGINFGRAREIEAMSSNENLALDQLFHRPVLDVDSALRFAPRIGDSDYYQLDSLLPSLFYAYDNSHYLETGVSLSYANVDTVANQRKGEHEALFKELTTLTNLTNLDFASKLVRAYLGLLNSQEFTELRAKYEDLYPTLEFPFTTLYQAILGQLVAYQNLVAQAEKVASSRKEDPFALSPTFKSLLQNHLDLAENSDYLARKDAITKALAAYIVLRKEACKEVENLCKTLGYEGLFKDAVDESIQVSTYLTKYLHSALGQKELAAVLAKYYFPQNYNQFTGVIALYAAHKGEYPTENLLKLLKANDYRVALPQIHKQGQMLFVEVISTDFNNPQFYQTNKYGIIEPKAIHNAMLIHHSDLLVVGTPVVAFDAQLNRMGMGGGYYDRLRAYYQPYNIGLEESFKLRRPQFVGLAYSWQEVPATYPLAHDTQLDQLCLLDLEPYTPQKLHALYHGADFVQLYSHFKASELASNLRDINEQQEKLAAHLEPMQDQYNAALDHLEADFKQQQEQLSAARKNDKPVTQIADLVYGTKQSSADTEYEVLEELLSTLADAIEQAKIQS